MYNDTVTNNEERDAAVLTGSRRTRRTIKWDEEVIKEHDKERGTRQKVFLCNCHFHVEVKFDSFPLIFFIPTD